MAKIDSIVVVNISRQTKFPSLPGFGRGAVIAEFAIDKTTNPLLGNNRYQLYSDTLEMLNDGWLETDLVYQAALDYFSQNPNPGTFMVGRKDSSDASWTAALTAIHEEFEDWYGFTIISNQTSDVELTAAWAETVSKIFGYTSSQTAIKGVDSAATSGFWRTLTPGGLAFFQATDDGEIAVSKDGGVPINVTGIDFSTTAATSGYFTSGDASGNLANFIVPITDGELDIDLDGAGDISVTGIDFTGDLDLDDVASTLQSAIQGADVSLTGVTVVYSAPNFVITSDSTGTSSSIVISATGGVGTDLTGSSYLNGGTSTPGTGGETVDESYTEIAATLESAIQAADGSLSSVTVDYVSDDNVFVFTSDTTGSVSSFELSSVSGGSGTDLYQPNYLNGGNSVQGKGAITYDVDDLATTIKALNYDRTELNFSSYAQDSGLVPTDIQFNWMGMIGEGFPFDPGSQTYAYKQLSGLRAESLTSGEINILQSKYVNFIDTIAGIDHVSGGPNGGKVMSGEYIDIIRGTDSLISTIQGNVFSPLINNRKIPFTNSGAAAIKGPIFAALQLHYTYGLLDVVTPDDVLIPDINDVPIADRANRILSGITFTARYAGAIQKVEIRGTISI
jgi:hypothetical protein